MRIKKKITEMNINPRNSAEVNISSCHTWAKLLLWCNC